MEVDGIVTESEYDSCSALTLDQSINSSRDFPSPAAMLDAPIVIEADIWDPSNVPSMGPTAVLPDISQGQVTAPHVWDELLLDSNGVPFPFSLSSGFDWLCGEDWGIGEAPPVDLSAPNGFEEEDVLLAEHVQHVPSISTATYLRILQFAQNHLTQDDGSIDDLPDLAHLDLYVQLYFEHFHQRMPFLHMPSFDVGADAWYLVFAVAALGCQYSVACQQPKRLAIFRSLGRRIFEKGVSMYH